MFEPSSKYVFKRKYVLWFIGCIDWIGYRCFPRRKKRDGFGKTILVIRVDHLGDIVLSEPFFRELKIQRPDTKIVLITTYQGESVFNRHPDIDEIISMQVSWFSQSGRFVQKFRDWISLIRLIRSVECDVMVDLRGDVRHILAAKIAKSSAWLVSYGITGGGFLLDDEASYSQKMHATERNLHLLKSLNLNPPHSPHIELSPHISSAPLSNSIKEILPNRGRKWIALHVGSGTAAKEWPRGYWRGLIERLIQKQDFTFFWIGDEETNKKVKEIVSGMTQDHFINLCGRLALAELGTFLKICDLMVSVDSGPVHIAAAHRIKTLVLFSGTNEMDAWRPLNEHAKILSFPVSCSPCHERVCPKSRHECMEGIGVSEAYESILEGCPKFEQKGTKAVQLEWFI